MKRLLICMGLLLFFSSRASGDFLLYSTTQGGSPAASYQGALYTFTDNTVIRGHFTFKNGFDTNNCGARWDAEGLVNGPVTISNASSLVLANDLRLGCTATLTGDGAYLSFDGLGNKVSLGNDMTLDKGILISSDLTIDGQGHSLTMGGALDVGRFITTDPAILTLKNMTLCFDNTGANWDCIFRAGSYVLENMKIVVIPYPNGVAALCSSIAAASGTLSIRGNVTIESPVIPFVFCLNDGFGAGDQLNLTINIEKNSTLTIGKNTLCALCHDSEGSSCTINFADSTSQLVLDDCQFYTSTVGGGNNSFLAALNLTKGIVIFKNKVSVFNAICNTASRAPYRPANKDMSKGWILGNGTSQGNVNVRLLGGAYVTLEGCMDYRHS